MGDNIMVRNSQLDRRTFLRQAAAAAATAVGAPCVMSAAALGREGHVPPSERIGLAFLGPGGRGCQLVEEFTAKPEVESLAVCDPIAERREKALRLVEQTTAKSKSRGGYRACQAYVDFREVLARHDIDGVVIAAPEHWRPIQCIMAAKAGKDVYTEKPFALTIGDARAMVEAVRRHGCIFQHGTQRRSIVDVRRNSELIRSGRIGKVTHAMVWVGPSPRAVPVDYSRWPSPPPRELLDWDLWLGPAALRPYHEGATGGWQGNRDFGLASIGNWGSHTLDMTQWALGKDAESPVEIVPPSAKDSLLALKYADGVTIYVPRTRSDDPHASAFGTEGQKNIWGSPPVAERFDDTPLGPGDVHLYRSPNNDHALNWLQCMRTRTPTICNEEVGFRSGLLCLLIHAADRLNRPLKFDPAKFEFPGDDEANRLLNTPKRAPWQVY
jgi:predicted dehydrogenase